MNRTQTDLLRLWCQADQIPALSKYTVIAMRVALLTTFGASKKEPLAAAMNRVRQAFLDGGLGEPSIRFNFGDPLVPGFVSSVDRVLKRYPELKPFLTDAEPVPGIRGARRISNGPLSRAAG